MVLIENYVIRQKNNGENFVALLVTGNVEMVKSKDSGKFYATIRKASIPTTFSEMIAKSLIGTKLEGTIEKIPCEPYNYTNPNGDEIEVDYTYEYRQERLEFVEKVEA